MIRSVRSQKIFRSIVMAAVSGQDASPFTMSSPFAAEAPNEKCGCTLPADTDELSAAAI